MTVHTYKPAYLNVNTIVVLHASVSWIITEDLYEDAIIVFLNCWKCTHNYYGTFFSINCFSCLCIHAFLKIYTEPKCKNQNETIEH